MESALSNEQEKPTRSFVFGFSVIFGMVHFLAVIFVLMRSEYIADDGINGFSDQAVVFVKPILVTPLSHTYELCGFIFQKIGFDIGEPPLSLLFGGFVFIAIQSLLLGLCLAYLLPALWYRFAQRGSSAS